MKGLHSFFSLRVLGLAFVLLQTSALASTPLPIGDFAKTPVIQSVSMSADGKNLVALIAAPDGGVDPAIATWNLDNLSPAPTAITPSGERMKFITTNAMKANRILAVARQEWTGQLGGCGEGNANGATRTFVTKVYLTDTAMKKFDEAFTDNTRKLGISEQTQRCMELVGRARLVDSLPLDPDNVIVSQFNEQTSLSNYFRYNLKTGKTELVYQGSSGRSPGLMQPRTGQVLTETELLPSGGNEYEQRVLVRDAKTGKFEVHEPLSNKVSQRYTNTVVGIDEATGKLYVLTDRFSDKVEARAYDPVKREFDAEPLVAHPQYSISALLFGQQPHNFNRIVGFVVDAAAREVTYVDPELKQIQAAIQQQYPGELVRITSYNDSMSRILFSISGANHPPSYHVLADKKSVITLGSQRPWVDASKIGEQRWVTYKARDGLEIPALLDLPASWKQGDKPLPAIVHPHGGPWARDYAGWDASGWVPFLTSRGYAVIRPQYRGSTDLGRKLWLAGDGQWGLKMQDDNDDAAAWLVEQGIAVKDRIAIFGYSYGGFAAVAAAVRKPSPYKCAIAGAPVADLARLGTSWSDNRLQRILQADTVKGMDPMRNTSNASIPILLFVGDRDVRTPSFHARGFYDAVKDKVSAKFEMIPDMPHAMPWYPRQIETTLGLIDNYLHKDCAL